MASNTVVVRVLGNTRSLSRSLNKARKDLQGLENINRNLSTAFRGAAIGAAVFGAAAVGAGAAGAAALAAIPVAITGIGIAFAAQNKQVKDSFSGLKDHVVKEMKAISKPFVPVLIKGAESLERAFDSIAPSLRRVMKMAAPLVEDIFGELERLAPKVGSLIEKAFKAGQPVIRAVVKGLEHVVDGLDGMFDALTKNGGDKVFAKFIDTFMKAVGDLLPIIGELLRALTPIGTEILAALVPALEKVSDFIQRFVIPAAEALADFLREHPGLVQGLAAAFIGLWAALKGVTLFSTLSAIIGALTTPVGIAVAAIAGLAFALYKAWTSSETFRDKVTAAWNFIVETVTPIINSFKTLAGSVIRDIKEWWERDGERIKASALEAWTTIKESVVPLVQEIADKVKEALDNMTKWWNEHGDSLLAMATAVFPEVFGMIAEGVSLLSNLIRAAMAFAEGEYRKGLGHLKDAGKDWLQLQEHQGKAIAHMLTKPWKDARKDIEKEGKGVARTGKAALEELLGGVKGKADKLPGAVRPGLKGMEGTVKGGMNRSKGAAKSGWADIFGITASGSKKSAGSARSGMGQLSSSVKRGMNESKGAMSGGWAGMSSSAAKGGSRVVGSSRNTASGMKGAFSGLSGTMSGIGSNIMGSLASAVLSAGQRAISAAASVASRVASAAKGALGIKSPSRVFREIGRWTIKGLIKGFEDGRAGIKSVMDRIADRVAKFYSKKFKSDAKAARATKAAMKGLENETRRLLKNATKRERIYRRLNRAEEILKGRRDARESYYKNIKSAVLSYGGLSSLNTAFTADAMLQQMKARIEKVRQYNAILKDLIKKGLNKSMIDQLAQAGVEGGLAQALAIQAGGKDAVNEFNALQKQLNSAAGAMGNTTADNMYKAGIQAAVGLVRGLRRRKNALERAAKDLGRAMVRAIKKELGIKSPSRVFARLGEQTLQGMQVGLKDLDGVKRATVNIGKAMENSFDRPRLEASAKAGGKGGDTVNITVQVSPTADKAAIGREVAAALDAFYKQGGRRLAT